MRAAEGDRSFSRRPGLRWAAGGAAFAILVLVLGWRLFVLRGEGPADANGVPHVTADDGLSGIVAAAVIVALVGWLVLRLQARGEEARRAVAQWQGVCDVLDVWQWRT